jgi:OmpA-OmpF porin, OOP family
MSRIPKNSKLICSALALAVLGGCTCYQDQSESAPAPAPAPVAEAPAVEPAPAPAPVSKTFSLSSEQLFDTDSSTLRPEGVTALKAVIDRHLANANVNSITVTGHTDSSGSDAYNQGLSERRANAVRDFLVQNGVDNSKIATVGRGESSPIATNDTAQGRQANRRVEMSAELVSEINP